MMNTSFNIAHENIISNINNYSIEIYGQTCITCFYVCFILKVHFMLMILFHTINNEIITVHINLKSKRLGKMEF